MKKNKYFNNLKELGIDYIKTKYNKETLTSTVKICSKEGEKEYTCNGVESSKAIIMAWVDDNKLILIGSSISHLITLKPAKTPYKTSDLFVKYIKSAIIVAGGWDLMKKDGEVKYTCKLFKMKKYMLDGEYTNEVLTIKRNYYSFFKTLHIILSFMKECSSIEDWGYPLLLANDNAMYKITKKRVKSNKKLTDKNNLLTFSNEFSYGGRKNEN